MSKLNGRVLALITSVLLVMSSVVACSSGNDTVPVGSSASSEKPTELVPTQQGRFCHGPQYGHMHGVYMDPCIQRDEETDEIVLSARVWRDRSSQPQDVTVWIWLATGADGRTQKFPVMVCPLLASQQEVKPPSCEYRLLVDQVRQLSGGQPARTSVAVIPGVEEGPEVSLDCREAQCPPELEDSRYTGTQSGALMVS